MPGMYGQKPVRYLILRTKFVLIAVSTWLCTDMLLYSCEKRSEIATNQAEKHIIHFQKKYGYASFRKKISVCIGKNKFAEIKNGAKIQAFYDRKTEIIYLRQYNSEILKHEALHAYIDKKMNNPPYSISEKLVNSLFFDVKGCNTAMRKTASYDLVTIKEWILEKDQVNPCRDYYLADKFIRANKKY